MTGGLDRRSCRREPCQALKLVRPGMQLTTYSQQRKTGGGRGETLRSQQPELSVNSWREQVVIVVEETMRKTLNMWGGDYVFHFIVTATVCRMDVEGGGTISFTALSPPEYVGQELCLSFHCHRHSM